MPAGAWSFEGSGWGGVKYITPELLRARGIGSGFYKQPGNQAHWGYHGPRRPGDVPDGRNRSRSQSAYDLEKWEPWAEWGGQSRYDELVKQYQDTIGQISSIPQVGSEDDLTRLTELDKQARGYQSQAQEHRTKGKGIQDDYIKEWLKAYYINYNPDAEVGGGRYSWDTSQEEGRRRDQRSNYENLPAGARDSGGGYIQPHWTSYGNWAKGRQDTQYRTINQHKWDDHALGALQRFKLKPPEPPPIIKDPAKDKTSTTNEYGRTDVDPMPDMDWFSGSPRGAQGVATQRGLTGRKKGGKYGKSFKRDDVTISTDSLNI